MDTSPLNNEETSTNTGWADCSTFPGRITCCLNAIYAMNAVDHWGCIGSQKKIGHGIPFIWVNYNISLTSIK